MKQKISAIVLLFSFIGVLAHDMIPHHHHDEHDTSTVTIQQVESHNCHASEFNESSNPDCNSDETFSKSDHDCPHHFHKCILQVYHASRSLTTENSQKIILTHVCIQTNNNLVISVPSDKIKSPPRVTHILRNVFLSNLALRAPPVIG